MLRHVMIPRLRLLTAASVIALLIVCALFRIAPRATGTGAPDPVILYSSDTSTLLFENFEGTNLADSASSQVTYAGGYLTGQALKLPDTTSFAQYSDSWLLNNASGFQESGTIEFYFRPESFVTTTTRDHAMLVTQGERATFPLPGQVNLSVTSNQRVDWALARQAFGQTYDEIRSPAPPLFLNQWYHIAITWSPGVFRLYKNAEAFTAATTKSVRIDPFFIGSRGVTPFASGLSAIGRIDRFRISNRARSVDEFPKALDVRIDSPVISSDLTPPFAVTYRAFATDSSPRVVDLYACANDANVSDAFLLARNMPESGTFLTGAGFPSAGGAFFLLAVARTAADSAFFFTQNAMSIFPQSVFAVIVDPDSTTSTVAITPTVTTDTFTRILLNGGGTTSGTLKNIAASDTFGITANYTDTSSLSTAGDSVKISIWTTETSPGTGIDLSIRSDTTRLLSTSLPSFISSSPNDLSAFGATVLSLEFRTSNGQLIGDSITTRFIGDKFSYNLEFQLSQKTTARFRNIGFDTSPGSKSFGFWFADTYGAAWQFDSTVSVNVAAGAAGGLLVRVIGITRDLPGGLGGVPGGAFMITGQDAPGYCVIERMHPEKFGMDWIMPQLRALRDSLLCSTLWRLLVAVYYAFCGWV